MTVRNRFRLEDVLQDNFAQIDSDVPPIRFLNHHRCHAISAAYPSPVDLDLVVTADLRGEVDATVVWEVGDGEVHRKKTFEWPNSLGSFFGAITEYLGFRANNGEGKVMGLAPYGESRPKFSDPLRQRLDFTADYDVMPLIEGARMEDYVARLESWFGESRRSYGDPIEQHHKDIAAVAQTCLENVMENLVRRWMDEVDADALGLAGGVALNCKMNKHIRELDCVDSVFIQPVAGDAGVAVGGALEPFGLTETSPLDTVYMGPSFSTEEIRAVLEQNKLEYSEPDNLYQHVARRVADGELVGWFQGSLEMGPRALGNRSILADPREEKSRDRVNKYVKHREEWRPFAPSLKESAASDYFKNATKAPFMIQTFEVKYNEASNIPAVLHPEDNTARPQTVREDQNPRYHRLLSAFEDLTGVPVLLNTSFNDSGEPIVAQPREAIRDFFSMGLDCLVLEDLVVTK
ncbi:carbamoyltransferase [Halobaculum sp. MBLA0147]|uniref:carbamoyltransferase family protein n=1 Tax=Halobaculum sp. MBLA0147 TaxID=3079934 RepID=UPI003524267F